MYLLNICEQPCSWSDFGAYLYSDAMEIYQCVFLQRDTTSEHLWAKLFNSFECKTYIQVFFCHKTVFKVMLHPKNYNSVIDD